MSSICRSGFVENAWRRDLCSNCFRTREEHNANSNSTQGQQQHPPMSVAYQYPAHQQPLYNSWRGSPQTTAIHVGNGSVSQQQQQQHNGGISQQQQHSNYGLPPSTTPLNSNSRYQSPSVGSGINHLGSGIPRSSNAPPPINSAPPSGRHQQQRTLYSTYNTDVTGGGGTTGKIISSSNRNSTSGVTVNVKVKKTNGPPPQAATRSNPPNNTRAPVTSLPNGGVSVSVGRSSSYSNNINTLGTRSGPNPNYNYNPGQVSYNNGNQSQGHSVPYNGQGHLYSSQALTQPHNQQHTQHLQQQRRVNGVNGPGGSSVSVLTQPTQHHLHAQQPQQHQQQQQTVSANHLPTSANNSSIPSSNGLVRIQAKETKNGTVRLSTTSVGNMDRVDADLARERKVVMSVSPPVASVRVTTQGLTGSSAVQRVSPRLKKGILKKNGTKRKLSVNFPPEVVEVIGYGGASTDEESDDEIVPDPLDSASVAEILDKTCGTPSEKEMNRTTLRNTNFNAIKNNLLGYAPIDIGVGIVGKTGGTSKPLVSIQTFESRTEPLRIRKLGEDEDVPSGRQALPLSLPKNSKAPITKTVTNTNTVNSKSHAISPNIQMNNLNSKENRTNGSVKSVVKDKAAPVTPVGLSASSKSVESRAESVLTMTMPSSAEKPVMTNNNGSSETTPLTNLIILTDGNIASRRTSFLREIIHEPSPSRNVDEVPLSLSSHDSLDPPRIIKSELKLDLTPITTSGGEYEDSLEADSGLDITSSQSRKPCGGESTGESESENPGSSSDSGNENDFSEREASLSRQTGLFIRTDTDGHKKPAKLSPDSVISEMSTSGSGSGSNESIPTQVILENMPLATGPTIPPMLKRTAPAPPVNAAPAYSIEDLYDDVASVQNQHQHMVQQQESDDQPEEEPDADLEESLYDDCAGTVGSSKANTGSYDFTDASRMGAMDSEHESVPVRQHEGIEFLGIRKIDSESFLRQHSPPPASPPQKKDRAGSTSPKAKRRVNQFFSTIGKRAGAAFSRSNSNTPNDALSSSPPRPGLTSPFSHKRSLSQDEVSMTRTQELYATLTPTSLKLRGLTPVLHKLSKLDLSASKVTQDPSDSSKKTKSFSSSIKKFLRFGPKDDEKYDLNSAKTEFQASHASSTRTSTSSTKSISPRSSLEPISPPKAVPRGLLDGGNTIGHSGLLNTVNGNSGPCRPPPPPPRIHSLDLLNTIGHSGMPASMKPARPPPPVVRNNKVAPSFTSVFAGQEEMYDETGSQYDDSEQNNYPHHNPPNKPKRKASMRGGEAGGSRGDGGAYSANYLETTYNHITSLNFETLKLIASQTPAKIKRPPSQLLKFNKNPLRWSQFYVTDVEPVCAGKGYAFYGAFWEDEPCILLLQESLSCGILPLEFDCVETSASFEDVVQSQFVTWEPSDYVNTGSGVRVFISVLASCTVQKLPQYLSNVTISPSRKYYALLQAMDFWGREELSDLLVFHQVPPPSTTPQPDYSSKSKSSPSPNFGLVYVVSGRVKSGAGPLSHHPSRASFEVSMKHLLLIVPQAQRANALLCDNDREILLRRISGSSQEVEAQLRLFLQLKLFGPQAGDLDKILRYRSEKQVTQWMDKERAFCMKDAIERTLQRHSEPISPLRKSFVEFLMISDNCAKALLDFVVDLYPDL